VRTVCAAWRADGQRHAEAEETSRRPYYHLLSAADTYTHTSQAGMADKVQLLNAVKKHAYLVPNSLSISNGDGSAPWGEKQWQKAFEKLVGNTQ